MPEMTSEVVQQALEFEPDERARLAAMLLDSLNEPDPAIEQLWLEESKHRIAEYHAGTMRVLSSEEFFRRKNGS